MPKFPRTWSLARRSLRFWWQRRTRGWDDSDTWGLDTTLARLIAPRLRRFKELNNGHPCDLTETEWDEHLDAMIRAFDLTSKDSLDRTGEEDAAVKRGLRLFARWYRHLWW
jgi:hypothetical protein